jgi:DNA primase
MKFHDSFLDEIRARLPVSQVVSRRVALKRAGREFKGLSPFNQEKTASFTVNDQKGFYHCFSSGKHGDIFGFVMETEGLSFPEAVERLAGDAGLPMPKPDPQFERIARERLSLLDAVEAAAKFFEEQLRAPQGRGALGYAEQRGLKPATLREFRIGFAPNAKDALKQTLSKQGFSEAQLLEAGLLIRPDDGRASYDRFRNRLIIPIVDMKSRVIAFGARALDPAAEPKYLNSPETKLFDKGSTIFNFARARSPAFDKKALIVVEGYMDVIALHQAGFANAVATLGTAFTERQMEQLWLLAREPVICFDGDRAGNAAADRAIDRMLPVLRADHSFRFAFLPEGLDPDDLVRTRGSAALGTVVKDAVPLIEALWKRETAHAPLATPEQKAALEVGIKSRVDQIRDPMVHRHYALTLRIRLTEFFWRHDRSKQKPEGSGLIPDAEGAPLERLILGLLVEYPELFENHIERVRILPMSKLHRAFRDELERFIELPEKVTIATFYREIKPGFFRMLDLIHGDEKPGLPRGHALYSRFAIIRLHPPLEFVDGCLILFMDRLQFQQAMEELGDAEVAYLANPDQDRERFLVDLLKAVEIQRERLDLEEKQLDEWAILIRSNFEADGSPAPTYKHANKLEETIARVRLEIIGGQRGRRPDRPLGQR